MIVLSCLERVRALLLRRGGVGVCMIRWVLLEGQELALMGVVPEREVVDLTVEVREAWQETGELRGKMKNKFGQRRVSHGWCLDIGVSRPAAHGRSCLLMGVFNVIALRAYYNLRRPETRR